MDSSESKDREVKELCEAAELGGEGSSSPLFPSRLKLGSVSAGVNGLGDKGGGGGAGLGGKDSSQAVLASVRCSVRRSSCMLPLSWRNG